MAELITTTGERIQVQPVSGVFQLEEMYALLHCDYVEPVHLADGTVMWLDEDGKQNRPNEVNFVATLLLHQAGGLTGDYVVGDVLITTKHEGGYDG